MQIRYKLNHPKQDRHTKLVWQPGDVKNVTAQVGEVLLRHPDVWEKWERAKRAKGLQVMLQQRKKSAFLNHWNPQKSLCP